MQKGVKFAKASLEFFGFLFLVFSMVYLGDYFFGGKDDKNFLAILSTLILALLLFAHRLLFSESLMLRYFSQFCIVTVLTILVHFANLKVFSGIIVVSFVFVAFAHSARTWRISQQHTNELNKLLEKINELQKQAPDKTSQLFSSLYAIGFALAQDLYNINRFPDSSRACELRPFYDDIQRAIIAVHFVHLYFTGLVMRQKLDPESEEIQEIMSIFRAFSKKRNPRPGDLEYILYDTELAEEAKKMLHDLEKYID